MNQGELVQKLDAFFAVQQYDERAYWQRVIPSAALSAYEHLARAEFFGGTWNGLMLDATAEVDRVYLIVFPGQAVLDTILALELERGAPGALIFAHHPTDFEESGRGFIGISEAQLEDLREHNISAYCCHAPLDNHAEINTASALAKALKLRDVQPIITAAGPIDGVHGNVRDLNFGQMAERLAEVTELPYIRYNQIRFNAQPVEHVAVLPGGGDQKERLERVRALRCDTLITGYWWPSGSHEYAEEQRAALRTLIPDLPMNLLGASHYASEMVVLRDILPGWFRGVGVEARFVRQPEPWR